MATVDKLCSCGSIEVSMTPNSWGPSAMPTRICPVIDGIRISRVR